MPRVVLTIREDERRALIQLSIAELRQPRDQVRFILRQELERCGLLKSTNDMAASEKTKEADNGCRA